MAITKIFESLVLVSQQNGVVVIPEATPLTRLNYFDGKFLRASDLKAEQDYLRQLVRQSNQAGGAGVAYGYDVTLGGGDTLEIGAGLAIDPQGRVLLLPRETTINIQELIDKSRALQNFLPASKVQREGGFELCELSSETPAVNPLAASNLFVITISHAEALCGEEDVFGKLCEEACVTSTDRPFVVEGLVVRAIPLALQTQLPNSKAVPMTQIHLRSRVASAYFEDERRRVASLISKAGLEQATWCLGADAEGGAGVPIGVVAREGATTIFLDPWIARRERIDAPAKRYWQWRMMMRPWDVFLAQILQFQCQLHDLFKKIPTPGGDDDPCGGAGSAIKEATETIAELTKFYEAATNRFVTLRADFAEELTIKGGLSRLNLVNTRLGAVSQALGVAPQDRLLIRGGIVELPSAGYLPVVPGAGLTINQQVRRMMGEGVDLRFCVVRHDYVAHALEEAQHMERISLLQGLDNPNNKPEVDILVPDGEIIEQQRLSPGRGYETTVDLNTALFTSPNANNTVAPINQTIQFRGAARSEVLPSGGGAVYVSAEYDLRTASARTSATVSDTGQPTGSADIGDGVRVDAFNRVTASATQFRNPSAGVWISLRSERNVFGMQRGDETNFNARAIVGLTSGKTDQLLLDVELNGSVEVTQPVVKTGSAQIVKGRVTNATLSFLGVAFGNTGPRKTILVNLNATVTFTGGSAIDVQLDHQAGQVKLSANWDGQPLEVKASITTGSKGVEGQSREIKLAAAALKENADALSAKNASHIQAIDALEVVAAALNDVTFADAKAKLLFPPPPKQVDELIVRGTKDWVLFHRRRAKQCSEPSPSPPPLPPPPRRYQVFHILAANPEDAQQLVKFLSAGQVPANRLSPVAVVEYGGGVAMLVTRPEDIQQDWQTATPKPGSTLVYGLIANRESSAPDGEALTRLRLDRLEDALAPISKLDPQAVDDFLDHVPASIPAANVDGVIILITLNQIEHTCHLVYRVSAAQFDKLRTLVSDGEIAAAVNIAQPIGEVNFNVKTADVPDNSLQIARDKWTQMGGGIPNLVLVTTSATDQTVPQAIAIAQARAIQKAFGPAGVILPPPDYLASPLAFPADIKCPAISFLAPQATRTALVVFSTPIATAPGVHVPAQGSRQTKVTFINNEPQGTALADSFNGLPPGTGLGRVTGVTLADIVAPLDADTQLRLDVVVNALRAAPGGPQAPRRNPPVLLSQADKDQLNSHGVSIVGVDEVIYLELFG